MFHTTPHAHTNTFQDVQHATCQALTCVNSNFPTDIICTFLSDKMLKKSTSKKSQSNLAQSTIYIRYIQTRIAHKNTYP